MLSGSIAGLRAAPLAKAPAYTLSGGERRRVEITRALVISPKFMLLDEPFAGLNRVAASSVTSALIRLRNEGISLVVVEHEMSDLFHTLFV